MKELNKAQLKYLRKLAHDHKAIFQMGKQGLTQAFIDQVDLALDKRELIKFSLLQNSPEDVRNVTYEIAGQVGAQVVQVIGHTGVLYRPSSQDKYQEISQAINKL